jgi:hypothetical protein
MTSTNQFPSPRKYGTKISRQNLKFVAYDGTFISHVIYRNTPGITIHSFLKLNRIGSVFDDLKTGQQLLIPDVERTKFSIHPER